MQRPPPGNRSVPEVPSEWRWQLGPLPIASEEPRPPRRPEEMQVTGRCVDHVERIGADHESLLPPAARISASATDRE